MGAAGAVKVGGNIPAKDADLNSEVDLDRVTAKNTFVFEKISQITQMIFKSYEMISVVLKF